MLHRSTFRRSLSYFAPDRYRILLLLGLIAASTLAGLLMVWPMAILVDTVLTTSPADSALSRLLPEPVRQSPPLQIGVLAASLLLLKLLQDGVNAWRSTLEFSISCEGITRVRCDLFRKLQSLGPEFHCTQPRGDTIFRLTNDASGCQQILAVSIQVIVAAFTLVAMLVLMLIRSCELTMIALTVVPFLLWTNIHFGRVLKESSRIARSRESGFTTTVHRSAASFSLMQLFGRQTDEYHRFRDHSCGSQQAWQGLQRQMAWYRVCVGLIFGLGTAAIFGWGGWVAYRDQILGLNPGGMTVGSLMVFSTYLGMLYDPLCRLSGAGTDMVSGIIGMERIFEALDRPPAIQDSPNAIALPREHRALRLENVSFEYQPQKPVLRNVSATIAPGEMVAFVGPSGVGKSTILNLLCRFYDPSSGSVLLDGHDLRDVRLEHVRRHIAVVMQDGLLLPISVRENIAYGRPEATDEEIHRAAELAGAAEFISRLPDGYDTVLAEEAANVSGGQRQRIAIARALLTEAPIIILDEPTSALDPESEQLVVDTLLRLKGRRTIILVSHRRSTVAGCDRIFLMSEGRIIDSGSYRDLVEKRGWHPQMDPLPS